MRSALIALVLVGCGAGPADLLVELKTDLRAPEEFAAVRVLVTRADDDAPIAEEVSPTFALTGDFIEGVRLTEIADLQPGSLLLTVELRDAAGTVVLARRVAVQLNEDLVVTVVLTRSCVGVVCPGAGDETSLTECLGGQCVTPECTGTGPGCGEPQCEVDADCTGGPACVRGACDDGVCLSDPDDAACADVERCDVAIGCTTGCPSSCDDGDPCTEDACDGARCQHAPNTGAVCDDGIFCNGPDTCAAGACTEHAGDPCGGTTMCDEAAGTCVGCVTGADCPDPMPGPWGSCAGFDGTCDETGTRARTVTSYACVDGVCSSADAMEDEACTRDREGVACGTGGATCMGGACSCPGGSVEGTCDDAVDDDCDGDVDCADADCDGMTCAAGGRMCSAGACECPIAPPTLIGSLPAAAPRIEWDGSAFGVLYSTSDYYFARISDTGTELASDVAVTSAGSVAHPAHFAFNGTTEYGIAWSDTRAGSNDVYFRRITTSGALSGPELVVSNDGALEGWASIGWDGLSYGVVWAEGPSSDLDLRFRRFTATGSPATAEVMSLDTPGFVDTTETVGIGSGQLAVGFHETTGPVLGVYLAILDASGRDLDGSTRVDDGGGGAALVDLAWTGSAVGIVWVDGRHGDSEIYFATGTTSGVVSSNVRVTNAAGASSTPRLAWSGSEFGVVWADERSGSSQIYFRRLSSTGAPIGGVELLSCAAVTARSPDVAWNGTGWGAVWSNHDGGSSRLAFRAVAP